MSIFDFAQGFIIFVIPGTILYTLFCYLIGKKPLEEWVSILYIFICSAASFLLGNFWLWLINKIFNTGFQLVNVPEAIKGNAGNLTTAGFISACISSILICFIFVAVWDKNWLFKIANFLHLTNRFDNCAVWDYMFDEEEQWIIFRDNITGNVYYGGVVRYSDGNDVRELFLEDVKVWSKKDGEYHMEKVYLARNPSEFSIEIDNYNKETEENGTEEKYTYEFK